jgi:hypothetical protein
MIQSDEEARRLGFSDPRLEGVYDSPGNVLVAREAIARAGALGEAIRFRVRNQDFGRAGDCPPDSADGDEQPTWRLAIQWRFATVGPSIRVCGKQALV